MSDTQSIGIRKMLLSIAALLAVYYGTKFCAPIITDAFHLDSYYTGLCIRAVASIACFVALGGLGSLSWLKFDLKAVGHAWRFLGYIIIVYIAMGVFSFSITAGTIPEAERGALTAAEALRNLLYITGLCVIVGINEEAMFRGLLFGGLLAGINGSRHSALWAAIISSVIFGFFHVMSDLNPEDPLTLAQGLMKTLQTGTVGLFLCVTVIEDHRLCGAMSTHGFTDWVVMLSSVLTGFEGVGSYVNTDPQVAASGIVLYAIMCVIYLPKTIQSIRRLLKVEDPEYGPFLQSVAPQSQDHSQGRHFA